jgi:hypothetical protein
MTGPDYRLVVMVLETHVGASLEFGPKGAVARERAKIGARYEELKRGGAGYGEALRLAREEWLREYLERREG